MKWRIFLIVLGILSAAWLTAACDPITVANLVAVIKAEAEKQARPETPVMPALLGQSELPAGLRKLGDLFGMEFVYVPAGEFTMGSSEDQVDAALAMCNVGMGDCDRAWFEGETPQRKVDLGGYWIGKTEVTNEQFHAFVEAGGYDDSSLWTATGWQWRWFTGVTTRSCWGLADYNQPNQPVVCVSWYEAVAYTRWLARETGVDVSLPSVTEWEKACRGTDGRTFPWGEERPDGSRVNYCDINCGNDWKDENVDDGYEFTAPVGSYPAGTSPYGALDMAGNVWEWTASKFDEYRDDADDSREDPEGSDNRSLRGGSWNHFDLSIRCAHRGYLPPDMRDKLGGFRILSFGTGS